MFGDEIHDSWRFFRDGAPDITVRVRSVNVSNDGDAVPLFLGVPSRRQLTPLIRCLRDFVAQRTAELERKGG